MKFAMKILALTLVKTSEGNQNPTNDFCADATEITSLPFTSSGDTTYATAELGVGTCVTPYNAGTKAVWYKVTGTGGSMTAETVFGSGFDTKLHVYSGSCGDFTCIDGNDDSYYSYLSKVTWNSVPCEEYYILVHAFKSCSGEYDLEVTSEVADLNCSEAPSMVPSSLPSSEPSMVPSSLPSSEPSMVPSSLPSSEPSISMVPSSLPSSEPSMVPSSLPSSSSSPSTSSAPTFPAVLIKSQKVKVSFTVLSGTLTVAQLEDIIVKLTKIIKDTIVITLRENGMRIDPENIVVTTTIKSSSRNTIRTRNIRSLQESTTSIEQEATFDAPTTTVDTTAIDAGITQATTTDSALSGVSSVSVILVVEPERKPCDGVNCGNAGKCVLSESNPTQPTCICENTFELTFNSKGKPSCTCGSDKIFNKDANRCFPPPTQAPTSAPFLSPTKSPVKEDEDPCVDDMISTFPLLNVDKEKGCRWLTKNKKKKRIRMEKYCGLDYVDSICPKTCGLC